MANFENAIIKVLANEGGYVNNPHDPGGETKYGITKKYLEEVGRPCDNMQEYTKEQAELEYRILWDKYNFQQINDNAIATSVFSAAVNIGKSEAVKIIQRACNKVNAKPVLIVDGIFGAKTSYAINSYEDKRRLLLVFRKMRADFYHELVNRDPEKYRRFLNGWLRVAYT